MARETWTWAELFAGLDPTPAFVEELERLGLLRVVARDKRGERIYDGDARDTLERVMVLVEAGYEPRDIAVIAHKVGLKPPRRRGRRAPTLLRIEDVARAISASPEQVQSWADHGWLKPQLATEGGAPLFAESAVDEARALGDLSALGLDAELATWSEVSARLDAVEEDRGHDGAVPLVEEAATFVRHVRAASDRLRLAARRWGKRLDAFEKRLERVRRLHAPELPRVKTKRRARSRLRRRAKTRSSAQKG